MSTSASDQLMVTVSELRRHFPNWRLGQLVANLAMAAGLEGPDAIWDVEDDRLLAAARRLIDRNTDCADSVN